MKIPKKIKIGGINYKVVSSKDGKCSSIDRETNIININSRLSFEQEEIALLHEIIHGINLSFDDEPFVEFLAQGLHQVLKDNKLEF